MKAIQVMMDRLFLYDSEWLCIFVIRLMHLQLYKMY